VTLRSASGNRETVILDGNYESTEIITVAASDVTIADLSIHRPYTHAIHVTASDGHTLNTLIHNVHIIDPREQAIKINPGGDGVYPDQGRITCCRMELTDTGRPHVNPTATGCYTGGVDAHQARDWVISDNHIEGFWCQSDLSEHAIHLWRGCRDTIVERNVLLDNARGVGFGMSSSGTARSFDDEPCGGLNAYIGHYRGIIRNNFIAADRAELFSSGEGFDCGVCLWSSCGTQVLHNSIASTGPNFSSIEWRFAGSTDVLIANNAASHAIMERTDASGTVLSNLEDAPMSLFVDVQNADLHLNNNPTSAVDQGADLAENAPTHDIDVDPRDATPDIGADEI